MLSHLFDRFYIITKFILPTIRDVTFLSIDFESKCNYLNIGLDKHRYPVHYLPNIKTFCKKIVPFFISIGNKLIPIKTVHDILTKEIPLILPNFQKNKREKRGIITSLVTCFIGLVCKDISSYLHNKRQTALKEAFIAMENQANLKRNKIFHLEDSMVMYGICNSDTLEKLINAVHKMHNKTPWNEKLFVGKLKNGINGIYLETELYIML